MLTESSEVKAFPEKEVTGSNAKAIAVTPKSRGKRDSEKTTPLPDIEGKGKSKCLDWAGVVADCFSMIFMFFSSC